MNFKINNINFGAKFSVWGKQTPKETQKVYDAKIDRFEYQSKIATQAQEYMQDPLIQEYIEYLPKDTFVRLHTGIIDNRGNKEDEILDFTPFLSFETKSINEQINITKELGANGDTLELRLNDLGNLDKKSINSWFENLFEFYSQQK